MTHLLLSGRPGAGKTAVGNWLAEKHGFRHIETDEVGLGVVQELLEGVQTRQSLGEKVVLEWGFPPSDLPAVRRLRDVAGFDAWWLDGDEPTCHQRYLIARKHLSSAQLADAEKRYQAQVRAIELAQVEFASFYGGDHIIDTVTSGPTGLEYCTCAQIVSIMLPDDTEA
jgi:hypothetical protein